MGGECKWQAEFSGETRAEVTRTEKPYRNVRAFPGIGMHPLRGLRLAKIFAQFLHKLREIVARAVERTTQSPGSSGVSPRRSTEAQVNATWKE